LEYNRDQIADDSDDDLEAKMSLIEYLKPNKNLLKREELIDKL
jgi:hypothetical protein